MGWIAEQRYRTAPHNHFITAFYRVDEDVMPDNRVCHSSGMEINVEEKVVMHDSKDAAIEWAGL